MTDEERALRRALGEVLEDVEISERDLARFYRRISNRIQSRIRQRGPNITIFELQREVGSAFEDLFGERVSAIETAVLKAVPTGEAAGEAVRSAGQAVQAPRPRARAVPEGEASMIQARVPATPKALGDASERIAQRTVARVRVPISNRIRTWDRKLGVEMTREVNRGIQQGKGILGAAREIQKVDTFTPRLPKYLQEVEAAARAGNIPELKELTKRYSARARKLLGELQVDGTRRASAYSLRSATQTFLRDIQKAQGQGIDRVVAHYTEERAQFQARLIARHESVEAFRESYIRESKDKPGVIGYRWVVSGRHKVPDECDIFAAQNLYNLGPGVYPYDRLPMRHPNCLCTMVAVVDREHFARPANDALPKDRSSPDAVGWLRRNEDKARSILGPTRFDAFERGVDVLDHEGRPRLVRDILGRGH